MGRRSFHRSHRYNHNKVDYFFLLNMMYNFYTINNLHKRSGTSDSLQYRFHYRNMWANMRKLVLLSIMYPLHIQYNQWLRNCILRKVQCIVGTMWFLNYSNSQLHINKLSHQFLQNQIYTHTHYLDFSSQSYKQYSQLSLSIHCNQLDTGYKNFLINNNRCCRMSMCLYQESMSYSLKQYMQN